MLSIFIRKWLKGFIHVWRATAYYMGVDEEANLVKDDFNRTKKLLNDIGTFVLVPAILNLNKVSLVMGKNVAEALDVDYHVAVYIAIEGYFRNSKLMSKLWNAFSIWQQLKYFLIKFLMVVQSYFTWFRKFLNKLSIFLHSRNLAIVERRQLGILKKNEINNY